MINQKHFIVAIILFGLFLVLPLVDAKLTFPINFRNIFSVSSNNNIKSLALSNSRLKIDNFLGQIAFWDENNNLTGDDALFWDNENKRLGIGTASPSAQLEIKTVYSSPFLKFIDPLGNSIAYLGNNDKLFVFGGGYVDDSNLVYINQGMTFKTAGNSLFAIYGGNVGIGTDNPQYKLNFFYFLVPNSKLQTFLPQ